MCERFNAGHALKSPAHITLQMPFNRPPEAELRIFKVLKSFAATQTVFEVNLSGFDCFRPRVIYVKIDNHSPILELHQLLLHTLKEQLEFTPQELDRRFHPHMTTATRNLTPELFAMAWQEFEQRPFEAAFWADHLLLSAHEKVTPQLYDAFVETLITTIKENDFLWETYDNEKKVHPVQKAWKKLAANCSKVLGNDR